MNELDSYWKVNDELTEFIDRIKSLCEISTLTRKDISICLGRKHNYITQILDGKLVGMPLATFLKMLAVFNISLEEFCQKKEKFEHMINAKKEDIISNAKERLAFYKAKKDSQ